MSTSHPSSLRDHASRIERLASRAVELIDDARGVEIELRLVGGLAIWLHCSRARTYVPERWIHPSVDIDLVARARDQYRVEVFLERRGYRLNPAIRSIPGLARTVFQSVDASARGDVSYGTLRFAHDLEIEERLITDYPTLPVAELCLTKLQIADLGMKDIQDLFQLLSDHTVGENDADQINGTVLVKVLVSRWGLAHTAEMALAAVANRAESRTFEHAPQSACEQVVHNVRFIRGLIEVAPKSLRFRIRGVFGERVRWFRRVNDVEPW